MSLFKKIFSKKETNIPLEDFSCVAVDFHAHLIPGIDDGVKTLEESVALIIQMQELGFKKIIATPHVVTDGYNNTNETILKGRDQVIRALNAKKINISFDAAAEYYVDETLLPKIKAKSLLPVFKNYVLIELSYVQPPLNITVYIYELKSAGYQVILAHPERYAFYYRKDLSAYEELKNQDIYFQLNISSFTGMYGKTVKQVAEMLVDGGMADFLSTDIHNNKLIPVLRDALKLPYVRKAATSEYLMNTKFL
ncbi:MAG: CpsB/CapC family capsule biosynthesis tyrosine phosphatase [Chitinophagales bacterium]|nr:histidinol phosphatase [Chitinophagales bacterium]MDW8272795.1 CpsB/CapC family capsule biosynthesis tyrosine phosphatase [Chitinophagales bacterium]